MYRRCRLDDWKVACWQAVHRWCSVIRSGCCDTERVEIEASAGLKSATINCHGATMRGNRSGQSKRWSGVSDTISGGSATVQLNPESLERSRE